MDYKCKFCGKVLKSQLSLNKHQILKKDCRAKKEEKMKFLPEETKIFFPNMKLPSKRTHIIEDGEIYYENGEMRKIFLVTPK